MQNPLNDTAMRAEEEMAKNAVCELITNNNKLVSLKISPEPFGRDTTPDYLLEFGEISFLEITLSGMGFLLNPKDTKFEDPNPLVNGYDRIQYECSAVDFLEKEYEAELKKGKGWIREGETLIIWILSPIPLEKRGRLSAKLLKVFKQLYLSDNILNCIDAREHDDGNFTFLTGNKEFPGLTIHLLKTMSYKDSHIYSPIKVNFFATDSSNNQPYDWLLNNQAWYILEAIIEKKSKKCQHLKEQVWLVIVNQHPLLDTENYCRGISMMKNVLTTSIFKKIFIVDDGKAHEIYHNPN